MDERKRPGDSAASDGTRISIRIEAPDQPEVLSLLAESDAYHRGLYPPENLYLLDPAALRAPGISFYVARSAGAAVGCGALVRHLEGYGEIKRMFVAPAARGHGVGRCILAALEAAARRSGIGRLRLETGTRQPDAVALYRATGFREVPPFAGYPDDPLSVFMEKTLSRSAPPVMVKDPSPACGRGYPPEPSPAGGRGQGEGCHEGDDGDDRSSGREPSP
jgi:putative acetyltransferase